MTDKILSKSRGRPRNFDAEAALDQAQALFHAHGYDAVGVAALTQALGINPPSFYAAFGSKGALFEKVLARYAASALPMDRLLAPGRDPVDALSDLLETAARIYVADPDKPGCMVLEGARAGGDNEAAAHARAFKAGSQQRIADFVRESHSARADAAADYALVAMAGLSAAARDGWDESRMMAAAHSASMAFPALLER